MQAILHHVLETQCCITYSFAASCESVAQSSCQGTHLGLCNSSIINLDDTNEAIAAAGLSVGAIALQVAYLLIQAHIVSLLACKLALTLLQLALACAHFFL